MHSHLVKNRPLLILLSGQWISGIGNTVFLMAVSWYVLSATHSRAMLGYVMAIGSLAGLLGLVSGVYADRWPHRRTLIATDSLRMILSLGMVVAFLLHQLAVVMVAASLFLLELSATLFNATEAAYLPEVAGSRLYESANGANQSANAFSQLVGLGLGGFLIALGGPVLLFFINGISFFVSALSLQFTHPIAPEKPKNAAHAQTVLQDFKEGLQLVRQSAFLSRLIPVAIMINFVITPLSILDVAWVRQVLHRGALTYGFFGVTILIGMIAGSVMAHRVQKHLGLNRTLVLFLLVSGVGITTMAFFPDLVSNLCSLIFVGFGVGVVNTALSTHIILSTAPSFRGRVAGLLSSLMTLATPIGTALAGWISEPLGLPWLFRLSGIFLCGLSTVLIGLPHPAPSSALPSSRHEPW